MSDEIVAKDNGQGGSKSLTFARLEQGLGEIEIEVKLLDGSEDTFQSFFDDTDPVTEREFKSIIGKKARNGNLNQKSFDEGLVHVFKKKFLRTNIPGKEELIELGYKDEKDYFLRSKMGQRYLFGMMAEYRNITQIDAEYSKN